MQTRNCGPVEASANQDGQRGKIGKAFTGEKPTPRDSEFAVSRAIAQGPNRVDQNQNDA